MDGSAICWVTPEEYRAVHRWAAAHDVAGGGTEDLYDAPAGGAINVWGRDGWENPEGRIHCTYYAERADGRHPGEILEELMASPVLARVAADATVAGAKVIREVLSITLAGSDAVLVVYEPGTHGGPCGRFSEADRWGRDRDWTAAEALAHFAWMFERALGRPLPRERRMLPAAM